MNPQELLELSPIVGLAALLMSIAIHFLRGGTLRELWGLQPALDDPSDPAVIAIAAGLGLSPQQVAEAFEIGWSLLRQHAD